jgi:hypothetical protein
LEEWNVYVAGQHAQPMVPSEWDFCLMHFPIVVPGAGKETEKMSIETLGEEMMKNLCFSLTEQA